MSTSTDFEKAIETEFFTKAAVAYPGVKIYTTNAKWKDPGATFYALTIIAGESMRMNIGSEIWERWPFIIQIDVFGPVETNTRTSTEMAETAGRWFAHRGFQIAPKHNAVLRSMEMVTGNDAKDGKFRVTCRVPGHRDVYVGRAET